MITFRLATVDDQIAVEGMVRRLREDDPEEGIFDSQATSAALPALLRDESVGSIWLIYTEQELAGYVALTLGYSIEFGGRIAFVDELFVERPFRRQGIGPAALKFVEEQAIQRGVRVLLLEVTCSNASAKRVYAKAGFVDRPHQLMTKRIG